MIKAILGNIIDIELDAIVNSANENLIGGSGVSGAIHNTAGSELEKELKRHIPLAAGNSIISKGYNLKSKNIIHTVAPKYYLFQKDNEKILRNCYNTSLRIANEHKIKSIGYPAIGIGVYKWPVELALAIAVEEIIKYMKYENDYIEKIYFIVTNKKVKDVYDFFIEKFRDEFNLMEN